MKLPRPDYLQLFGMNGITGAFLTSGFGRVDALRWFDAAFFAKIADTLAPNPETEIRDLLEGLSRSVKMVPTTERQYPPRSLLEIWERGYGNAADRVRVFAELCRQKGYETWLVQFRNADNGDVLAQYCELRRDGWKTVIDVAGGREIGDVAWNHLESSLRRDSGRVVTQILAMAEAADYRSANQRLADLLKQVGQSDSTRPAFGLDPFNAIQAYLDRSGGRRSESIGYWQIPLIALHPRKEEAAP
jgi:hypothetical protein